MQKASKGFLVFDDVICFADFFAKVSVFVRSDGVINVSAIS